MGRRAKDGKQYNGVRRRPGEKVWYVDYRDADGKWPRKKAYASRRQSVRLRARLMEEEQQKADGLLPRISNKKPLDEVVKAFREYAQARLRPRTFTRYFEGIEHCLAAMPEVKAIGDVTPGRVEQYLARRLRGEVPLEVTTRRQKEVAARTCNIELAGLKRMLNRAADTGLVASNPIAKVKLLPKKPVKVRRALTDEAVDKLLRVSAEPWRTVWLTFLLSGLRHRELLELRWQDVDLRQGRVYVRPEVEKAKRGRWVTVPLSLAERFREMQGANGGEYVFDQPEGLRRKNLLLREFYRCLKAAGIARDGSVDIHALRYTYVTALLRRGVNLKVVQKLAGHSTLEMTLNIYAQVFKMDERDAAERLPWCKVFQPLSSQQAHGKVEPPSSSAATTAVA